MSKWKNCKSEFPCIRENNSNLSEIVLVYSDDIHSLEFYDYVRKQWYDLMFQCYLEEQGGVWCYSPKPQKRIKIRLEKINGDIELIIRKEVSEGKRIKNRNRV